MNNQDNLKVQIIPFELEEGTEMLQDYEKVVGLINFGRGITELSEETNSLSEALFIPANSVDTIGNVANWSDYAIIPAKELERLQNVERKSNVYR